MDLKVILLAVLATLSHAKEATYELVFSDEDLFTACPDAEPGTLDIHGFLDLSEWSTSLLENGVTSSGNLTFIWDIQPQDRVKLLAKLLYFDRGTWTPTVFSYTTNDFCKSMYDPIKPWYKLWTGHVTNVEDVRDKCLYPGTKLIMETFLINSSEKISTLREGHYKFRVTYQAFDFDGNERPTNICYEALGHLYKK